jgi:hypothetical protein
MGTDLPAAAELLGRALQAPENSARILKPAIGALTDAQKDAITAFTQAGDSADAQAVILDAVESKVKGAAAAYGQTLPGQIDRATESWKDAKAELVGGFAPAIELGANLTTDFAHAISSLPDTGAGRCRRARARRWHGRIARQSDLIAGQHLHAAQVNGQLRPHWRDRTATAAGAAAGTGFAASLGPIALVVAGIGVLATALALTGGNEHNAAVDATDFTQALKSQSSELDKNIDATISHGLAQDKSATAAANAGVSYKAMFEAVQSGTDDFSTLREEVESLGAKEGLAGQGTTDFSRQLITAAEAGGLTKDQVIDLLSALEGLHNKFIQQKAAHDAENAAMQQTGQDAGTTGQALLELSTHEQVAAQSAKDLAAAQQAGDQQRATRLSSVTALFSANQSLTSAEQQLTQAERGQADAARGVEDAHRRVGDAERSRTDAVERLTEAEEALQKAQQPADAETLGKAQLDLADAHNRVGDAQSAVTAAEREAAKERKDGQHTAADVADADRKILEAKNSLQRAIYAEHDADVALQQVQAKGTDQDQAVIAAKKGVEDATRQVDDATRGVSDALRGVSDAQQRVIDSRTGVESAYLGIATASAGVKDAQDQLFTGTSNATLATGNLSSALDGVRDKLDPSSPLLRNIDGYIGNLAVLRDIFSLDSSVPTEDILNRHVASGQPSLRDSGGPLSPGQKFQKLTPRAELFVETGTFRAPDYAGIMLDPADTAQLLASPHAGLDASNGRERPNITWHGDVINPVPEPASSSVAHQLSILADRLAGAV